jgi:DNA polymerase/3'-5' exonuclease PolX
LTDDNDLPDDETPVSISAKDLKALRNIARTAGETQQQFEAAQRQLAFAKAKIDVTDPKMGYFIKGYEGDLDPEKIRSAATEAGFITTQSVQIPPTELSGHQQMGDAAAGGSNKEVDLAEKIRNAQSQEEVMAIMTAAGYPTSWGSQ